MTIRLRKNKIKWHNASCDVKLRARRLSTPGGGGGGSPPTYSANNLSVTALGQDAHDRNYVLFMYHTCVARRVNVEALQEGPESDTVTFC